MVIALKGFAIVGVFAVLIAVVAGTILGHDMHKIANRNTRRKGI